MTSKMQQYRKAKPLFIKAIDVSFVEIRALKDRDEESYHTKMNKAKKNIDKMLKKKFLNNQEFKEIIYPKGKLSDFFNKVKRSRMKHWMDIYNQENIVSGKAVDGDFLLSQRQAQQTADKNKIAVQDRLPGIQGNITYDQYWNPDEPQGEKKNLVRSVQKTIQDLDNLSEPSMVSGPKMNPPDPFDQAREETRRHLEGLAAIERLKQKYTPGSRGKTKRFTGKYSKFGKRIFEGGKRRTRKRRGRRKRGGQDVNKNELVVGETYFWIRDSQLQQNWLAQGIFQGYEDWGNETNYYASFSGLILRETPGTGVVRNEPEHVYSEPLHRIRHIFNGATPIDQVNKKILEYADIESVESINKGNTKGGRKTKRRRKRRKRKTRRRKRRRLNQVKKQIGCKKY